MIGVVEHEEGHKSEIPCERFRAYRLPLSDCFLKLRAPLTVNFNGLGCRGVASRGLLYGFYKTGLGVPRAPKPLKQFLGLKVPSSRVPVTVHT